MPDKFDILQELKYEDLTPDMQLLAESIGIDAVRAAIAHVGGLRFNIPMAKSYPNALKRYIVNNNKLLDNHSLKKLAINYNIGEQTIRKIYYEAKTEIIKRRQNRLFDDK